MLQWSAPDPFHHQILRPIVAHAWSSPFVFWGEEGRDGSGLTSTTAPFDSLTLYHHIVQLLWTVRICHYYSEDVKTLDSKFTGQSLPNTQKTYKKKMSAWGTGGESALLQQRTHGGKLTRWDWLNVFFIRTVREWQCGFPIMWHTFCCRLLRRVHNA